MGRELAALNVRERERERDRKRERERYIYIYIHIYISCIDMGDMWFRGSGFRN